MAIAGSVLRKFVELTKEPDTSTGYYVYGTAIVSGDGKYVKVDGSESLTSVSIATDLVSGDRVLVYIEGHKASVIGNVTCPASGRTAVDVSNMLEDFSTLVVGSLYATYAEIESIKANYVTTEYLEATYATITDLKVVFESVDYLYAGVANIETLLGGEGGFGELESIHLSADNAVIDQAVIVNAVAGTIMADLILTNFINTDLIKIGSTDGTLWIDGSTILIIDTNENYRIQIGLDNNGDYNLALWDEDGNCMWNAAGVTEYGINDGVIRDEMVAADAAIQGSKLDIESICSIINDNGDYVINAGSVKIDDQSLDVWYTQITQQIEGLEGLSTEGLTNLEPWFCLWESDTEAPPIDASTETITQEWWIVFDEDINGLSPGETTLTLDVTVDGYEAKSIVSYSVTSTAVQFISVTLDKNKVTIIVNNTSSNTIRNGEIELEVLYSQGDSYWINVDIPVTDGLYKWVCWKGYYADGHTEWSIPYCLTDGYIRSTTSVLQTELEVVQGQIEAYVWQTEYEISNLEESIKDTWADIKEDLEGITETVGEMQTTVYGGGTEIGLITRISEVELTSTSISESVSNVESWLGDYYSNTKSLETLIQQTAEDNKSDILLEVSYEYATTSYVSDALKDLDLSGVENIETYYILTDSVEDPPEMMVEYVNENFSDGVLPSGWARSTTNIQIEPGYAVLKTTSSNNESDYLRVGSLGSIPSGIYTITFKAKGGSIAVWLVNSSNASSTITLSDDWEYYTVTIELPSSRNGYVWFLPKTANVTTYLTDISVFYMEGWSNTTPTEETITQEWWIVFDEDINGLSPGETTLTLDVTVDGYEAKSIVSYSVTSTAVQFISVTLDKNKVTIIVNNTSSNTIRNGEIELEVLYSQGDSSNSNLWECFRVIYKDGTTEWLGPFCANMDLSDFATIVYTDAKIETLATDLDAAIIAEAKGLFVTSDGTIKSAADIYQYVNNEKATIILEAVLEANEYTDAQIVLTAQETESSILMKVSNSYVTLQDSVKYVENYYAIGTSSTIPPGDTPSTGNVYYTLISLGPNETETVTIDTTADEYKPVRIVSYSITSSPANMVNVVEAPVIVDDKIIITVKNSSSTYNISVDIDFDLEFSNAGWSTDYPIVADGEYLWVDMLITYADGTSEWTNPICMSANFASVAYTTAQIKVAQSETEASVISEAKGLFITSDGIYENAADIIQYIDAETSSITLEASGGLGGTAFIQLTSNNHTTPTTTYIDLSEVRKAFENDNTAITIGGNAITFVSNSLVVESDRFRLDANGNLYIDTNQFLLDWDGNATFSGYLSAPSGHIGGFEIGDTALYTDNKSTFDSTLSGVYLGTDGICLSNKFSVDSNGNLFATQGSIGGFTINDTAIYNGMTEIDDYDNNEGVYIGTDGIGLGGTKFGVTSFGHMWTGDAIIGGFTIDETSIHTNNKTNYLDSNKGICIYSGPTSTHLGGIGVTGSDASYVVITEGTLGFGYTGAPSSNGQGNSGYLSGYQYNMHNGGHMLRMGAPHGFALCTGNGKYNTLIVIDEYPDVDEDVRDGYLGVSGTITVVTSITSNSNGGVSWETKDLTFVKGILNTELPSSSY